MTNRTASLETETLLQWYVFLSLSNICYTQSMPFLHERRNFTQRDEIFLQITDLF